MNRRKSLLVALLCAASGSVMAQSVEDGLKDLYYGKNLSAKQTFEKVIAAKPTDDKAYYYMGIAQLALEDVAGATATFQKGLQAVPTSALLQAGMGRIDLIKGDAAAAKTKFEAASAATQGRDGDVARAIADASTEVKGGDRAYALTVMDKLLNNEGRKKKEMYTATAADYIEQGDAYRYLGGENGGKAIGAYEKALELSPNNAEAVMKEGMVNYNARLKAEAVADWTKATNMDPNYAPAFHELFLFYTTPKKDQLSWDKAAEYLEKYMKVADPADKLKNEYYSASISFFKKDYDNAISKGNAALAGADAIYKGKFSRLIGDAYLQKGDSLNAKKVMDEYAKSSGNKLEPNDYKLLSEIYGRVKVQDSVQTAVNDSLASLYLEKYATSDTTKDVDTYRNVAESFKKLRDFKRSAEWYTKLVNDFDDKANPGKLQDYFWKGTMEMYARDYDAADATYGTFITKYPEQEAFGLYWRGRANMAKDPDAKLGLAVPYFQKFFEIDGPEKAKIKAGQLMYPYQYLMIYYYNKEDKANLQIYMDKVLSIDPTNATVKQIKENQAAPAAKPAAKPAGGTKAPQNKK
ncbi:tetratricopeptide repeat protein [Chitinophaga flava]|nr:hypothetical protein [Chitinophaga flava]